MRASHKVLQITFELEFEQRVAYNDKKLGV
jgi:hypothetical protein